MGNIDAIPVMPIDKTSLIDPKGLTYKEFKRTLKPRWMILWFELLAGHLALIITALGILKLEIMTSLLPLTIIMGAVIFGFIHAYIHLFFHEAAH